jgi:hypothetical protein
MDMMQFDTLIHSFTTAASRRGALGALSGGLLAAGPLVRLTSDSEARKRGKRKRRKNKKGKKQKSKTIVDATCSGPFNIGFKRDSGTARFAQTFTAIASGALVKAEFDLAKDTGSEGDYILRLSSVDGKGVPTNDVLAETTVANADVPAQFVTVPFTFTDPFPVEAGKAYALVLTRPGGQLQLDGNRNNPCSGQAFVSEDQTAPFNKVEVDGFDFVIDFIVTTFIRS